MNGSVVLLQLALWQGRKKPPRKKVKCFMAHFGKEKEETLTLLWISPTLDLIMHPLISWDESQLVRLPSLSGHSPRVHQTSKRPCSSNCASKPMIPRVVWRTVLYLYQTKSHITPPSQTDTMTTPHNHTGQLAVLLPSVSSCHQLMRADCYPTHLIDDCIM